MNQDEQKKKGAQLKRVHTVGTQVVDTCNRRRQKGTKMEVNFTVKRNNADEEQKFFVTERVDHKLEKQVKAEAKQNHTFVKPKLNFVDKVEVEKVKITSRGKERAANFAFFKELVNSNKVEQKWNVETEKEIDEVDLFFMKKKTKPFSGFSIKSLGDSLKVMPDEKHISPQTAMSSINENVATDAVVDVIALTAQLNQLIKRVEALELDNKQLVEMNNQLRQDNEKLVNEGITSIKNDKKEKKNSENKIEQAISKTASCMFKIVAEKKRVTQVTPIVGEEQCLELQSTIKRKYKEKPKLPSVPSKKEKKSIQQTKIRQWYNFNKQTIEEHQKEVLSSVQTDVTFAEKVKENGIPKQKLRYTVSTTVEKQPKKSIHHYGYKPAGVPNKIWWKWVTTGTAAEAYKKAQTFLFKMFKREMIVFRQKWICHTKEFNPYLSEPKMVWLENTNEYPYDVNVLFEFIKKWRMLVTSYKPGKSIINDWYKNKQN